MNAEKKNIERLIAAAKKEKAKIAASRDKLRGIIEEVEELECNTDDALNNLTDAVDCLSRLL